MVRQYGKGKWKRILEMGTDRFNNRTQVTHGGRRAWCAYAKQAPRKTAHPRWAQVDLKDKWRNLCRQKVVEDVPVIPDGFTLPAAGETQMGAVEPEAKPTEELEEHGQEFIDANALRPPPLDAALTGTE